MLTALLVVAALFVMGYFFRHAALGIVRGPIFLLAHYFYYRDEVWTENTWMGHKLMKLPFDLWTYQEIIYRTKPDIIVETGTFEGGSAQYFAGLFDLMGAGKVITVDIDARAQPPHHRIEYLSGSSTAPEIFADVKSMIPADARVMVVLDSDHSEKHVREELALYAALVTPGCYLVVEDTNVNGHPVSRSHGPGPMEAVRAFMPDDRFATDAKCERHGFSFYPSGWLVRLPCG